MKRIVFDEVIVEESPTDFTTFIRWIKDGKKIHELRLDIDLSEYPLCKSCLLFFGEKQYRNKKITIERYSKETNKMEQYTRLQCSNCGSDGVVNCSCGEAPRHKLYCPLGFDKYFMP